METDQLNSVTAQEMRGQLSDLLNRAAYAGESTLVTRQGKAVAVLVPVDDWERYLKLKNSTGQASSQGLAAASDPTAQG
ncbi:type II toxin-antitoxin system Phd/YefM family antitoxin [Persicitalea sp.]|uniref:type II toxin-antitoxin system Phd/YefM family antitoxin n=1 Tax=Persicitalea sp. TaxID=3100273 RepID=UPI0035934F1F